MVVAAILRRRGPPAATPRGAFRLSVVDQYGHDPPGVVAQVGEADARGGQPVGVLPSDDQILAPSRIAST